MRKISVPIFIIGSLFIFVGCQKHSFDRHDTPITTSSVDTFQVSEISPGGGISQTADSHVQVQATVGHLFYSQQVASGDAQSDTGIWNILGNIF